MPNQLIHETSPYLLQHANNPVNWYPWGPEALEKAKEEHKPIFLSIGYAACHWCHVMEHESFEDAQTAQLLNDHFVSIKVDREERPDLDGIYMNAVVAMTGQGGWPMSLFLTPQGEPFYAGTYFPNTRRYGMPSFLEVLTALVNAWENEQGEIQRVSREVTQHLQQNTQFGGQGGAVIDPGILEQAAQALIDTYDWKKGGWGSAPRFPQAMAIDFLLMQATRGNAKALEAASHALTRMSRGGMYDTAGGGFHRYSTDDEWLVPHFEKMLYDNAQLALAYLHAYLLTGKISFRQTCLETLDFMRREMTHPQGGFFSSLDADSEGEEGKYYLWTPEEIAAALPDPAERELFDQVYLVTAQGNFEGRNILRRKDDLENLAASLSLPEVELIQRLNAVHQKLYAMREKRIRPKTDDKVLVSWNALALRAFSESARYLRRTEDLETARKAAGFLLESLKPKGTLLRSWRNGEARHPAYLEDYAALSLALLNLYESDPDPRWYAESVALTREMEENFRDPAGGFFDTRSDQGGLITRPKEVQDNALPSGSALAVNALLRLAALDERDDLRTQAETMLSAMQTTLGQYPTAFSFWLQGLDFAVGPVRQVALVGPHSPELITEIWRTYRPRLVSTSAPTGGMDHPALLRQREMVGGKTTAYVCEGFICRLPVTTLDGLKQQLGE